MPGFIAAEMRRTTRELLLVNGAILLALAGAAVAARRYLHNFFAGPFPTRIEQLDAVTNADALERRFVTVAGDRCFDTGWSETSYRRTKHGTVTTLHRYSLLVLGERALVVNSSHGAVTRPACSGELVALPAVTRHGVEAALERAHRALPPRLLAVELVADDYRATGIIPICLGVPLALLTLWNLVRGFQRWRDPSRHPIVRSLERCGDFVEVATAIEVELAAGVTKVGPFRLTSSWLLRSVVCRLDVLKLEDVLWAIPRPGRHPALEIRSRGRPLLRAPLSSSKAHWLLGELARRAPWIALGDGDEWRALWKEGADAFARTIDERRRKLTAERVASPVSPPPDPPSVGEFTKPAVAEGVRVTLLDR